MTQLSKFEVGELSESRRCKRLLAKIEFFTKSQKSTVHTDRTPFLPNQSQNNLVLLSTDNLAELLSQCARIQNESERGIGNSKAKEKHVTFNFEDFCQTKLNSNCNGRLATSCNDFHQSMDMSIGDFCKSFPRLRACTIISYFQRYMDRVCIFFFFQK